MAENREKKRQMGFETDQKLCKNQILVAQNGTGKGQQSKKRQQMQEKKTKIGSKIALLFQVEHILTNII